jgi:hypothetical protein
MLRASQHARHRRTPLFKPTPCGGESFDATACSPGVRIRTDSSQSVAHLDVQLSASAFPRLLSAPRCAPGWSHRGSRPCLPMPDSKSCTALATVNRVGAGIGRIDSEAGSDLRVDESWRFMKHCACQDPDSGLGIHGAREPRVIRLRYTGGVLSSHRPRFSWCASGREALGPGPTREARCAFMNSVSTLVRPL